jgi:protein TonB
MTEQTVPYSLIPFSPNQSFLFALTVAIILHIILVLGVQIPKPEARQYIKDIDITLIDTPSTKAPENSDFLAQDNQLAQGQLISKPEPAKPISFPQIPAPQIPVTQIKPIPEKPEEKTRPKPETKQTIKTPPELPKPILQKQRMIKTPPETVKPVLQEQRTIKTPPEQIEPEPQKKLPEIKPDQIKPVITAPENSEPMLPVQTVPKDLFQESKTEEPEPVEEEIKTQRKPEPEEQETATQPKQKHSVIEKHRPISAAALQQQISEQAIQSTQRPASAEQTKTKSVSQVSANKSVAAQYKRDWETKVERIGNLNYPEAASKPGFSATLTMDVGIKADGSIDSIRITQTSGIPELDEAAKKIVRMSAPFPPLPNALRNELDILLITRVWKFTDESGLITQ